MLNNGHAECPINCGNGHSQRVTLPMFPMAGKNKATGHANAVQRFNLSPMRFAYNARRQPVANESTTAGKPNKASFSRPPCCSVYRTTGAIKTAAHASDLDLPGQNAMIRGHIT